MQTSPSKPEQKFAEFDPFSRNLYCILGVPIDAVTKAEVVERISAAAARRERLFLSTPNLNFLVNAQSDPQFRRSLVISDLCPADGMGVLLVCRLLGLQGLTRVAGSDLPEALRHSKQGLLGRPLRIALFGGAPGVGQRAADVVNRGGGQTVCVGAIDPGNLTLGSSEDERHIASINQTNADFLLVALGASKGQQWIVRNLPNLKVPIVSHLGATINFLAGSIQRAPPAIQRLGLEWLWRIKEEPKLVKRYAFDGMRLAFMVMAQALPLALWLRRHGRSASGKPPAVIVSAVANGRRRIAVSGYAGGSLQELTGALRSACSDRSHIEVDLAGLTAFDLAFAGKLLLLEQHAIRCHQNLRIVNCSRAVARALRHCGLGHLISD